MSLSEAVTNVAGAMTTEAQKFAPHDAARVLLESFARELQNVVKAAESLPRSNLPTTASRMEMQARLDGDRMQRRKLQRVEEEVDGILGGQIVSCVGGVSDGDCVPLPAGDLPRDGTVKVSVGGQTYVLCPDGKLHFEPANVS